MNNPNTMLAAALALAIAAPAHAQVTQPSAVAGAAPTELPAREAQPDPARLDRPEDAAFARIEAEPRQAFWGYEPGRPYEETDSYTPPRSLQLTPIQLSGYAWVDTGYMQQKNTQPGTFDKGVNYAQGRFVLGASYRRDLGNLFAEARVQLVGFDNEYTKSQYEPHTQDAFVRVGGRSWDVQLGRFLAWEPYYRGNGIERYTAEEAGALNGVSMYRLDYGLGHEDEPGQIALHLYPAGWAALEVSSVYGQQSDQNKRGVRPALALRRWGFLLMGGWEYLQRRPQADNNKAEQTANGFAGRVQYTLAGTTVGVDAARVSQDQIQSDGLPNARESFDKTSYGAFLEADFWRNVVGAGYHLTTQDNDQGERNKHHQAFVSYTYRLPIEGLSVKAVLGFARAQNEDVDARLRYENDMTSFRVRVKYDFR